MLDLEATTTSEGLDAEALYGRSGEITFRLLLAAMRDGFESPLVAARVPELVLGPLSDVASAELLDAQAPTSPEIARNSVLHLAAGNRLALVELPRALGSERLAGGPELPGLLPLTDRLQRAFAAQASTLPAATSGALLVAAVDDRPLVVGGWRAAP